MEKKSKSNVSQPRRTNEIFISHAYTGCMLLLSQLSWPNSLSFLSLLYHRKQRSSIHIGDAFDFIFFFNSIATDSKQWLSANGRLPISHSFVSICSISTMWSIVVHTNSKMDRCGGGWPVCWFFLILLPVRKIVENFCYCQFYPFQLKHSIKSLFAN